MGFFMDLSDEKYEFVFNKFIGGYNKPGYTVKVQEHMRPIKDILKEFCNFFKENDNEILY